MARHDSQVLIPVSTIVRDYFPHLSDDEFVRNVASGEIRLPLIRTDPRSQKTAKGVHILDLAKYIDTRRAAAARESDQMAG